LLKSSYRSGHIQTEAAFVMTAGDVVRVTG